MDTDGSKYIPVNDSDEKVENLNVLKLMPLYVDKLGEYKQSETDEEVPYIHVEIFRDGSSLQANIDQVLRRGLSNAGSRQAAANDLDIEDVWTEEVPSGPVQSPSVRESDKINEFSEVYWKKLFKKAGISV